jgi:Cu+-exporting ATPase
MTQNQHSAATAHVHDAHCGHEHGKHDHDAHADALVKDPVCGMSVNPENAKHRMTHEGAEYYFCSAGCRTKFAADPQKYLAPKGEETPAPAGTIYTCPMHPEVRRDGPGACPICGMALEPLTMTAEAEPNHELIDMQRRLWIGMIFTIPLVILDMGGHFGFFTEFGTRTPLIEFVLATPVVVWCGLPFFQRGWMSLVTRHLNMFTLVALGTGIAWTYSAVATFAPRLFPLSLHQHDGTVPVYFEAAAVITLLVLVGQVLELRARERTGNAIRALLKLAPKIARRIRADGTDEEVPLDSVVAGDQLRVRPGEQVPVDGVIVSGQGTIDQSMMTGEPIPVVLGKGDKVLAATLNGSGGFVMTAEKVGSETTLSRIVQMVSDAQRSRAPIQQLVDQVAGWFVPLVIAAALLAFAAWITFGPEPRLPHALIAAVAVLIIACPCALGLATPMSIMVGIGRGARAGVLMRNADALQTMEKVDTLLIDKTGTLTEGRPTLATTIAANGFDEAELLRLAAGVERASEHPLGAAIVEAVLARNMTIPQVSDFTSPSGHGASGTVDGKAILIGHAGFLKSSGIDTQAFADDAEKLRLDGATVIFIGIDGQLAGLFALTDKVKPGTPAALEALHAQGLRIIMLTGDNATTAQAIARQLHIDEVKADTRPEDKAALVNELRAQGRIVAMAGDGINDAPALAAANIGIAMGTGTDVAIESAGITLVKGDLSGIVSARNLSLATMKNIRGNLFLAFAYNSAGIPIAAGILYPTFGILLSPVVAAAAMALSSVSVIANALRLSRLKL